MCEPRPGRKPRPRALRKLSSEQLGFEIQVRPKEMRERILAREKPYYIYIKKTEQHISFLLRR
jgi:hypothetical protein